jgi:hypothetical protein
VELSVEMEKNLTLFAVADFILLVFTKEYPIVGEEDKEVN